MEIPPFGNGLVYAYYSAGAVGKRSEEGREKRFSSPLTSMKERLVKMHGNERESFTLFFWEFLLTNRHGYYIMYYTTQTNHKI